MSTENVLIRALEPDDYAAWTELRNCPNVLRNTLGLPYSTVDSTRRMLEEGKDRFRSLVAVVGDRVVGSVSLETMRYRRAHAARIGVMVHDDYARRGVGSALMRAMIDMADNWLNLHRLELEVYTDNAAAIALYERFGFEIEGTLQHYAYGDGRYLDVYAMARLRARA